MNLKASFIKENNHLLSKNISYVELDKKYIKWMENKLSSKQDKIPDHIFTDLQFIYDHFGELPQVEKFNEEVMEFIESGEDEELVDVWMVATQLIMNSKKLLDIVEFKRERTLKRIKSKFYDVD